MEFVNMGVSSVLQFVKKKKKNSPTSLRGASDWHLTNVAVRLLFALRCTSEKLSGGILS